MYKIIETEVFSEWFAALRDATTRSRLFQRLKKVRRGLLGDIKSVGEGVWEMRENFGAGWRMYYLIQGDELIFMLGGGSKASQTKDIEQAKAIAKELKNEQNQNPRI